jgi:ATP synthase protein I
MAEDPDKEKLPPEERFRAGVERRAERHRKAEREKDRSIWFSLGLFGLVGWSIAVPALIGVGLGLWIDARWPSRVSWTLTLLFIGVVVGCLNAWYWIKQETQDE